MATEGINGTVGGTVAATQLYISAMCSHPRFRMDEEDFKVQYVSHFFVNAATMIHSVVLDLCLDK